MTISLKAAADGLSGTIQVGGVDKVTIDSGGIASGYKDASVTASKLSGLTVYTTAVTPLPSAGVSLTGSHSLGVVPVEAVLELTCITAELNYSIGDVVQCASIWNGSNAQALHCYKNTTTVGVPIPAAFNVMAFNKTTGATVNFTAANWSYRFRLRAA